MTDAYNNIVPLLFSHQDLLSRLSYTVIVKAPGYRLARSRPFAASLGEATHRLSYSGIVMARRFPANTTSWETLARPRLLSWPLPVTTVPSTAVRPTTTPHPLPSVCRQPLLFTSPRMICRFVKTCWRVRGGFSNCSILLMLAVLFMIFSWCKSWIVYYTWRSILVKFYRLFIIIL